MTVDSTDLWLFVAFLVLCSVMTAVLRVWLGLALLWTCVFAPLVSAAIVMGVLTVLYIIATRK